MIDQHFINHYNKNNSDVNLIIDVMCHPKKEDARMFLCMINDVMNYYISRIDDEVRYRCCIFLLQKFGHKKYVLSLLH